MLVRRLPGILPRLPPEEALEVTRIHSVAGLLPPGRPLVTVPPFRAPHHTASVAAIVGGGPSPRPGEASLAHRGVLFLDELAEFPRNALEALRQPLEDGFVAVARVGGRLVFPARFQLVGTMNLCPCGARGDPAVECTCSATRLAAYRDKLSRALLDRFDLVVTVPRPRARELEAPRAEGSDAVAGTRRGGTLAYARGASDADAGGKRAPDAGGRASAALRARTRACCPRRAYRCSSARRRGGGGRARRGSALVPLADGARGVSDLALAAFAAATDSHVVREPKEVRFRRFERAFDESAYRAELEACGYRFLGRSAECFPRLVRELHDPPPGLFLRGAAGEQVLGEPSVAIVGARSCSSYGRQVARQLGA